MPVEFRLVLRDSPDYPRLVALREAVLRTPLGLSYSVGDLAKDEGKLHLAGFDGEEIVASMALAIGEDGRSEMLRVAIAPNCQGQGVGSQLLVYAEQLAREHGCHEMFCSAREPAYAFYLKHGYAFDGEEFIQSTLPHRKMRKRLIKH